MIKKAHALFEDLVHWRRDIHTHPELGFTERRTAELVAQELEKMGYRVRRHVGKTGVVADLGSEENGRTIAIRADMDALPILETTDHDYVSITPGIMHACGHDSHTAMALGAAAILAREKFPGRVRFLFQPSEEMTDEEGLSGAPRMIADGALDGVDMVIAQHVDPHVPVGTMGISAGPISGGVDNWFGRIMGVGGHGAHPYLTVDPFNILAHVIMALNGIISRRIDPFQPVVISIGVVRGGFAENVIPEEVQISGTLRYANPEQLPKIHEEIRRAFEISRSMGGNYDLRIEFDGIPGINHPAAAQLLREAGEKLIGAANTHPEAPTLGAEDFGVFCEKVPGAMFTLGTLIEGDERYLHHPRFDIDERALPLGTAILAEAVLKYLREDSAQ